MIPVAMPTAISQPALADLVGVKRAFLVGIDGVGMSGAARLLLARGVAVSGSGTAADPVLTSRSADSTFGPMAVTCTRRGADMPSLAEANAELQRAGT